MRQIVVAVVVYVVLNFLLPSMWERFLSSAPTWAMNAVLFAFSIGCIAAILFAEPVFERLRNPTVHPIVSTTIVSATCALLAGAGWWFLVVSHTAHATTSFASLTPQPPLLGALPVGPSPAPSPPHTPSPPAPNASLRLGPSKYATGWTIHKNSDDWFLSPIIDATGVDTATASLIDRTVLPLDSAIAQKAKTLWDEMRTRVPAPKLIENELGVLPRQQVVEHINRSASEWALLQWNYEILRDGSGIQVPENRQRIAIDSLTLQVQSIIPELDAFTVAEVNKRYVDALLRSSK